MRKTWLAAALAAGHARLDPESKGKTWTNILCEYRPYDLRHRFATRVRQLGADLADVQELLGHKDIRTTRRYAPVVHAKLVSVVNALVENDDEEERSREQRSDRPLDLATA
jgi:integrase